MPRVIILAVVGLACVAQAAAGLPFINICGNPEAKNISMDVSGCSESDGRCNLIRGTSHTIRIYFTPPRDFSSLTMYIHGVFTNNLAVPYGAPKPALAQTRLQASPGTSVPDLGESVAQKPLVYQTEFFIMPYFPPISLSVRFRLVTLQGAEMACLLVPVKIQ